MASCQCVAIFDERYDHSRHKSLDTRHGSRQAQRDRERQRDGRESGRERESRSRSQETTKFEWLTILLGEHLVTLQHSPLSNLANAAAPLIAQFKLYTSCLNPVRSRPLTTRSFSFTRSTSKLQKAHRLPEGPAYWMSCRERNTMPGRRKPHSVTCRRRPCM